MKSESFIGTWMEKIRDESPKRLEIFEGFEVSVSPAERIRYRENTRFGTQLAVVLKSLSGAQKLTRENVLAEAARLEEGLRLPQRRILSSLVSEALKDEESSHLLSRESMIAIADQALIKFPGFEMRISDLPEEDVILRPFGIMVVYVREQEDWEKRVSLFSRGNAGFHMRMTDDARLVLRELGDQGVEQEVVEVSQELTEQEIDQLRRMVFVRLPAGASHETVEPTIRHEIAHAYFDRWVSAHLDVREKTVLEKEIFLAIKDELIAYALRGEWKSNLGHLLNLLSEDDSVLIRRIDEAITKEYQDGHRMESSEAQRRARVSAKLVWAVRQQMMRLDLLASTSFQEGISILIGAQSLNEVVVLLRAIDRRSVNLTDLYEASLASSEIWRVYAAVSLSENGVLGLTSVADARRRIQDRLLSLREMESTDTKDEQHILQSILDVLKTRRRRQRPKPTP